MGEVDISSDAPKYFQQIDPVKIKKVFHVSCNSSTPGIKIVHAAPLVDIKLFGKQITVSMWLKSQSRSFNYEILFNYFQTFVTEATIHAK